MRFRPLTRPLFAPRRARVLAALSLMTLVIAVMMAIVGVVSLEGALLALGFAAALAIAALTFAFYGLGHIWNHASTGISDVALSILWAIPVLVGVTGLAYLVNLTPSYPDLATDVNDPPSFELLGELEDGETALPLDAADPAERIRLSLAHPDLRTVYVERPAWHLAEVLETLMLAAGWTSARLDTPDGQTYEAEFQVPGAFVFVDHDVSMRITDDGGGSVVDARALSNIPLHDFGTNAPALQAVIDQFLLAVEATPPPTSDL
ncbi:MAG: DUF1499 domain-containing protein [Cohaesibacteraceae bacterium]